MRLLTKESDLEIDADNVGHGIVKHQGPKALTQSNVMKRQREGGGAAAEERYGKGDEGVEKKRERTWSVSRMGRRI